MPIDAPALTGLARRAKAHWGYPAAWLEAWRDELTITPAYLATHRVLVAEHQGGLRGVCALEDHGATWALEHVWVDPASHGMGVGRALVREALVIARRTRPGVVTVKSDPHAAGFYRRLGAAEVGVAAAPVPGDPGRTLPLFEFGPA